MVGDRKERGVRQIGERRWERVQRGEGAMGEWWEGREESGERGVKGE